MAFFYVLNFLKNKIFLKIKSNKVESMAFSFFNYAFAFEVFYKNFNYLQIFLILLASMINFLIVSFLVYKTNTEFLFRKIPKSLKGNFIIIINIAMFSFVLSTLNLILINNYTP